MRVAPPLAPGTKRTRARNASRKDNETIPAVGAPETVTLPRWLLRDRFEYEERLSATDISALASMKNVAKCDTWCELQNPVNHRVFERKLRPRPSGRGHVCLGVTRRCPPQTPFPLLAGASGDRGGRRMTSRARASTRGWSKNRVPCHVVLATGSRSFGATAVRVVHVSGLRQTPVRPSRVPPTRPQVRRGYPLSLSISISGGKETYKDSPSNGERTGKSPG